MECTADPCHSPLVYKGGENKEDYGCRNPNCQSRLIQYHPNVKVRRSWYYAAGYSLPFTWIDSKLKQPNYNYRWYALVGSPNGTTQLQGLKLVEQGGFDRQYTDPPYNFVGLEGVNWECRQEVLHFFPYCALPANKDFKQQFYILRDRVMNEWLNSAPKYEYKYKQKTYNIPFDYDDDWWADVFYGTNRGQSRQQTQPIGSVGNAIVLDAKLKSLIELATNNSNDNEASNAAREACRRLRKQFK